MNIFRLFLEKWVQRIAELSGQLRSWSHCMCNPLTRSSESQNTQDPIRCAEIFPSGICHAQGVVVNGDWERRHLVRERGGKFYSIHIRYVWSLRNSCTIRKFLRNPEEYGTKRRRGKKPSLPSADCRRLLREAPKTDGSTHELQRVLQLELSLEPWS